MQRGHRASEAVVWHLVHELPAGQKPLEESRRTVPLHSLRYRGGATEDRSTTADGRGSAAEERRRQQDPRSGLRHESLDFLRVVIVSLFYKVLYGFFSNR